jgi:hypothetical protein
VDTVSQPVTDGPNQTNPIGHWIREGYWPEEYFDQDDQTRKDLEKDSWYEKYWIPNMDPPFARKKSSSSLRRKQSEAGSITPSSTTPSGQPLLEAQGSTYKSLQYKTLLATKKSFMDESSLGITDRSKNDIRTLLDAEQEVPKNSLFRDDLFKTTCRKIQDRNETRVIRDISLLIVPSAEVLATYGSKHLEILIESTNEGWNNCIPLTKPRPQPDYSVGFRREAFTEDQLNKLRPFVGDVIDNYTSFFMATYYMYYPFLTCEVKSSAAALEIADRQNAHSMTVAVKGIVELFKLVKREQELDREILAFSISHDNTGVRIYGHHPVINGKDAAYYRHPIKKFDFTSEEGKERWTAYQFTKNVYDIWMPSHFQRICSAIDQIPEVNFDISLSDLQFSQRSDAPSESLPKEDDGQISLIGSADITPETSLTQQTENIFKKPRKR